jgi:hypothetical protein
LTLDDLLIPYWAFMIGGAAFVLWKGSAPERYGVGTIITMAVFQITMEVVNPSKFYKRRRRLTRCRHDRLSGLRCHRAACTKGLTVMGRRAPDHRLVCTLFTLGLPIDLSGGLLDHAHYPDRDHRGADVGGNDLAAAKVPPRPQRHSMAGLGRRCSMAPG